MMTDTPPSAAKIIEQKFGWRSGCTGIGAEMEKALSDAGYVISRPMTIGDGGSALFQKIAEDAVAKTVPPSKIIVDKDELQDICNAIAVGDQASAWEKLTSMTTDIGSGEEQEEGFFGGKSIPPPWDTGS